MSPKLKPIFSKNVANEIDTIVNDAWMHAISMELVQTTGADDDGKYNLKKYRQILPRKKRILSKIKN